VAAHGVGGHQPRRRHPRPLADFGVKAARLIRTVEKFPIDAEPDVNGFHAIEPEDGRRMPRVPSLRRG
jgi:hypothetical protein